MSEMNSLNIAAANKKSRRWRDGGDACANGGWRVAA